MSAKKVSASVTSKPFTTAIRKSPTNGKAAETVAVPKPATKKAAAERTLATLHIGEVAGEIWKLLSETDSLTLAAIKKSVDAPADVVAAAVGWLAREGKLEFTASGKTLKIALRP